MPNPTVRDPYCDMYCTCPTCKLSRARACQAEALLYEAKAAPETRLAEAPAVSARPVHPPVVQPLPDTYLEAVAKLLEARRRIKALEARLGLRNMQGSEKLTGGSLAPLVTPSNPSLKG